MEKQPNQKKLTGQRVGIKGYLSLIARVRRSPATLGQVTEYLGVTRNRGAAIIRSLRAVGLLRVSTWVDNDNGWSAKQPVFGYGGEPDEPHPTDSPRPSGKAHNSINATAIAAKSLIRAIVEPASKGDIAKETGISLSITCGLINHMTEIGLARVSGWLPTLYGGPPTALYVFGNGPSAARPKPIDTKELGRKNQAARARRMQQIELIRMTAAPANDAQIKEAA